MHFFGSEWKWKSWVNYPSSCLGCNSSFYIFERISEKPIKWSTQLLWVKRDVCSEEGSSLLGVACQVFEEGTLRHSECAWLARVTDIRKTRGNAVQYQMPIRQGTKDGLNVFHSNEKTKCWSYSCPFFQGWLWHESLLYRKVKCWTKDKEKQEDKWLTLGNHWLCRLVPLVITGHSVELNFLALDER